jgi:alanine dehydrogenase
MSKINIPKGLTEHGLSTQEEMLQVHPKKRKVSIGIPKERAFPENRIALTPAAVRILVKAGHHIVVEKDAGERSGFIDYNYSEAGTHPRRNRLRAFRPNYHFAHPSTHDA